VAKSDYYFGFLNVSKPRGITAHDVVAKVRRALKVKQVGHAGTLDPLAEGVLPIAVGKATRLLRFLGGDKTYLAEIQFGIATSTDDLEGEIIERKDNLPQRPEIIATLPKFHGTIMQVPPLYSAVHQDGKRLYELARKGEAPEHIEPRQVTVHKIEFLDYAAPFLSLRITCSAGTYIRSIARDLGALLGCGGTLSKLKREQAGPFAIDKSFLLSEVEEHAARGDVSKLLISPQDVLDLTKVEIDQHQKNLLNLGQAVLIDETFLAGDANAATASEIRNTGEPVERHVLALHEGSIVAVCRTGETIDSFVRIQPEVVVVHGEQVRQ
jgi:tRNA pseudouridine55 synthase